MLKLTSRNKLPALLNDLGLCEYGVEIGVRYGTYSKRLLTDWLGERLYLVDAWRQLPEMTETERAPREYINWLQRTAQAVAPFGDRAVIIQATSQHAVSMFPQDMFDVVYLDANHGYEETSKDLSLWWPTLRYGGIFAGHDYYNAAREPGGKPRIVATEEEADLEVYGVKKAVDKFAASVSHELVVTTDDPFPTWLIRK